MYNNQTNVSGTAVPDPTLAYVAASSYLTLSLLGLALYITFLTGFIQNYKTHFSQHSFYILVLSLALGDLGYFATNIFLIAPHLFSRWQLYTGWLGQLVFNSNSVVFFGLAASSFLIAVDRFLTFFRRSACDAVFERPRLYVVVLVPWLYSCSSAFIHASYYNCPKIVEYGNLHITYACTSKDQPLLLSFVKLGPSYLACTMAIMYVAIYIRLHQEQKKIAANTAVASNAVPLSQQHQKRERLLLTQGFWIAVSLLTANLSFNYLPLLSSHPAIKIVTNCISILNSMSSVCIYAIFNSEVRSVLMKTIGLQKTQATAVAPITAGAISNKKDPKSVNASAAATVAAEEQNKLADSKSQKTSGSGGNATTNKKKLSTITTPSVRFSRPYLSTGARASVSFV